jgi:septal ring factor EnvC (AmiA/AmiB activator)
MVRALDDIDETLKGLEEELVFRHKELSAVKSALLYSEHDLAAESERVTSGRNELERSLKALYAFGQGGYIAVLLSSDALFDTLKRQDYLGRLISYDKERLVEFERRAEEIGRRRDGLEKRRKKLVQDEVAITDRIKKVMAKRAERMQILARVRSDPTLREVLVRESAKRTRKLDEAVSGMAGGTGGTGFASMKGTMPWPARGVVESGFGVHDDELYGIKKLHKGWDIRSQFLSEVRAVHDGRVVHSGWMRGFGNVLVLDHGEGYMTIYAHLARADRGMGDTVKVGEVIAYVGDTASNKGPFLYFEIRRAGKPLDPADWLEGGR